jgi:hypothetical protein
MSSYLEAGQISPSSFTDKLARRAKLELAKLDLGKNPTNPTVLLTNELYERAVNSKDPIERVAREVIKRNTLVWGDEVTLKLSSFHTGTFLRDAFAVCQFADSRHLTAQVLEMFAQVQDPDGYVPTSRFAFDTRGFRFQDESTAYFPILAHLAYQRYHYADTKIILAAEKALGFLAQQTREGGWVNKDQTRTYWADELILPPDDVVSFKTGLAAVALKVGENWGYTRRGDAQRAVEGYRANAQGWQDRMALSLLTGDRDVTALYPEYLAFLLGESMLDRSTVSNTIQSFATPAPRPGELPDQGLRVIRGRDGRYLGEEHFVHPPENLLAWLRGMRFMDKAGFYQNGGTWPWFDHAAWCVAVMHGLDPAQLLPEHNARVFNGPAIIDKTFVEYPMPESLPTGNIGSYDQHRDRINQTWNVAILDQQRQVAKFLATKD